MFVRLAVYQLVWSAANKSLVSKFRVQVLRIINVGRKVDGSVIPNPKTLLADAPAVGAEAAQVFAQRAAGVAACGGPRAAAAVGAGPSVEAAIHWHQQLVERQQVVQVPVEDGAAL
jgi:hypothetical protein